MFPACFLNNSGFSSNGSFSCLLKDLNENKNPSQVSGYAAVCPKEKAVGGKRQPGHPQWLFRSLPRGSLWLYGSWLGVTMSVNQQ